MVEGPVVDVPVNPPGVVTDAGKPVVALLHLAAVRSSEPTRANAARATLDRIA
jgi:hypothetical protein